MYPESCATCHGEVGENVHQAVYDAYVDPSALIMTFDSVVSTPVGATYTVALNFHITKNGLPYIDANTLPSMSQRTFYFARYDSTTRTFPDSLSLSRNNIVSHGDGSYTLTTTGMTYAPELSNAVAYGYIAQDQLDAGIRYGRVRLYDNMDSAALAFGDADTYESAADVNGCIRCHGTPYRKHGYREAVVENLPDFVACKTCHWDTRDGGHQDWQWMVDDPLPWAEWHLSGAEDLPPAIETAYAYTANVMNDVHMSHAMEFPYPMSMANCATCHANTLEDIRADEYFTPTTCLSCHPLQDQSPDYPTQHNRAPALEAIWPSYHEIDFVCTTCHSEAANYGGRFSELHTGYNELIYNAAGQRYSDLYSVSVDSATLTGDVLDIQFSSNNTSIVPTVTVSLYGWDSKHFIVSAHSRDETDLCWDSRNEAWAGCRMEFALTEPTPEDNPLFTEEADSVPGDWHVTLDFSAYQVDTALIDSIPTMIADGRVKKAEIAVLPRLRIGGQYVAVPAVSRTFDLGTNAFVPNYFQGTDAIASTAKCNACHDALATTFHNTYYGGKVEVCRTCHVTTSGGSHLEMQSRGIDSYVHAIHAFQDFDTGDIDFTDPVEAARYGLHIEHTTPIFSLKACEACHMPGTYNVPDQSESMPGLASTSDTWNVERNIGTVPEYVSGPASRACGGCHRAELINEDHAGDLAAFNQHVRTFGYLVVNDDPDDEYEDDVLLYGIIDKMMEWFE